MANPFVEKEVQKIISENQAEFPKNHALACAWIIANFKGVNIKIFDVRASSSLCDYNVIASAGNTMQAKAMVDEICYNLKRSGAKIISLEGLSDGDWILVDLGDVIVHIFQEISRDIFDLDTLWSKFPQIEIPSSYYFGQPELEAAKKDGSTDSYF